MVEHATGASLRHCELQLEPCFCRASRFRGGHFAWVISCRIEISEACSAPNFLSRSFSSSRALRHLPSPLFMPPYRQRLRLSVASLTSSSWRTSPTLLSAESVASASCSYLMIFSGECRPRFLLMVNPLRKLALDFHNTWSSFWRAFHATPVKGDWTPTCVLRMTSNLSNENATPSNARTWTTLCPEKHSLPISPLAETSSDAKANLWWRAPSQRNFQLAV
ncbi:hypothetical protein Poly24_28520 [Rosistilla carotiformis]|uniref:Uncharacterized protein n=1 Tax=Rosistilla carotiformis TaxID=2528017 RepID=A0A518JUB6_9BACT|nr:hypothetical protein Poly24_28520 [Rosistilla carotiformis]